MKKKGYVEDEDDDTEAFFTMGVEQSLKARDEYQHKLRKRKAMLAVGIIVGVFTALALIIALGWGLENRKLKYRVPPSYTADKDSIELLFFAVGDWGRQGNANQKKTARMMAQLGAAMRPQFIVSTGDNFYESGLKGVDDLNFKQSFIDVYTDNSLQVPWYAVLGNHDYGDKLTAATLSSSACAAQSLEACNPQCCYSAFWQTWPQLVSRDSRFNATQGVVTRSFPLRSGRTLDMIMIDTNPLIARYRKQPWAMLAGGINSQDADALKAQIVLALNSSQADWKVVVGHHPVRSLGSHCMEDPPGDCGDMSFLRPLLAQYGVALYLNGHDHDLQVIRSSDDPVLYVVSGAGSDTRPHEFNGLDPQVQAQALYLSDEPGFVAASVVGDRLKVYAFSAGSGHVAYEADQRRPM